MSIPGYWAIRRTLFFCNQRAFAALSFLLLDNRISSMARIVLLRWCGVKVGEHCFIRGGPVFQEGFSLIIGDHVFINGLCCFDTSAPIRLGNYVQIAYQVTFITGGHKIGPPKSRAGEHRPEPIVVEDGVWIGARATILPGVTIGYGAVVAAGSLVTRDVPPNSLVAGVPAKVLRSLAD